MKRHDLYFLHQEDACQALQFIKESFTSNVILSNDRLTFVTLYVISPVLQRKILGGVNSYRSAFNQPSGDISE
jgi:hypothetical protein